MTALAEDRLLVCKLSEKQRIYQAIPLLCLIQFVTQLLLSFLRKTLHPFLGALKLPPDDLGHQDFEICDKPEQGGAHGQSLQVRQRDEAADLVPRNDETASAMVCVPDKLSFRSAIT